VFSGGPGLSTPLIYSTIWAQIDSHALVDSMTMDVDHIVFIQAELGK
jgi:hypothetical protein